MRRLATLIVLTIGASGAGVRAQGIVFGHPSLPSEQPTFRIKAFSRTLALPKLQAPIFNSPSEIVVYVRDSRTTCPMPVLRGPSRAGKMPVWERLDSWMPVVKGSCRNPLDQQP